MADQVSRSAGMDDFATWEPVLRLLWREEQESGLLFRVTGCISRSGSSLPLPRPMPEHFAAVRPVQDALVDTGVDEVSFTAEIQPTGRTVLRLFGPTEDAGAGLGTAHPEELVLVEGALPEPWRRLPDPTPDAAPAQSAHPELLARILRERLPTATGADEDEITAAERRLGIPLPEELKALYRVTRARWEDWDDQDEEDTRHREAVGCDLLPLDELHIFEGTLRMPSWCYAAQEAAVTGPDDAVQGLPGSPGWIVFGGNGWGDLMAVDVTPGPGGHHGQVIAIGHDRVMGADLVADSLTGLVTNGSSGRSHDRGRPTAVARVGASGARTVEAAAHPGLEVLIIGASNHAPFSLAPVTGLPRLRTLTAKPGTLADQCSLSRGREPPGDVYPLLSPSRPRPPVASRATPSPAPRPRAAWRCR
ncbi:SMI1/KNR4 family protein [Streptomyces sp. NPDC002644]